MKQLFNYLKELSTISVYRICMLLLTNNRYNAVAAISWPIIEFPLAVYIINLVFQLVLAGYQPA